MPEPCELQEKGVAQPWEGKEGQAHRKPCSPVGGQESLNSVLCGTKVGCLLSINSQWWYPVTVTYVYSPSWNNKNIPWSHKHTEHCFNSLCGSLCEEKIHPKDAHPACWLATPWAVQTHGINVKNTTNAASLFAFLLLLFLLDLLATCINRFKENLLTVYSPSQLWSPLLYLHYPQRKRSLEVFSG